MPKLVATSALSDSELICHLRNHYPVRLRIADDTILLEDGEKLRAWTEDDTMHALECIQRPRPGAMHGHPLSRDRFLRCLHAVAKERTC